MDSNHDNSGTCTIFGVIRRKLYRDNSTDAPQEEVLITWLFLHVCEGKFGSDEA